MQLEKQVNEVEQSTADIQVNIAKGSFHVKDKGQQKHFTRTRKQHQDASHREAAAAYKMRDLLKQSSTILDQASASLLQLSLSFWLFYGIGIEFHGCHTSGSI